MPWLCFVVHSFRKLRHICPFHWRLMVYRQSIAVSLLGCWSKWYFWWKVFPFFWRWKGERMDWHKDEALTLLGAVPSLHLCWICFWEILRSLERKSALNQRELKLAKRRPQVYLLTAGIYFKFAQRKISNCVPSNRAGPVLQIWELCPIVIREA